MDIEYLKKVKKEKKMTLQDISDRSGIPKRTVDGIFSGKTKNPRIDTMQAIEKALGIEKTPPEETEGAQEWMQLYYSFNEENRVLLVKFITAFKDMPPERRRFIIEAFKLAKNQ